MVPDKIYVPNNQSVISMDRDETKWAIARKMLLAVMTDNDMVSREEPLDEKALEPWIKKTEDALTKPFGQMGEGYFSDKWIDDFCTGDEDFQEAEIKRHKSLEEVFNVLNDFFENYGKTDFDIELDEWCDAICDNTTDYTRYAVRDTACHFAEWQQKRDFARLVGEWESGRESGLEMSEKLMDGFLDRACDWLKNNIQKYINGEFNEFHHTVEYDGTIDKEKLEADFRKEMESNENPGEEIETERMNASYLE